MRDRRTLVSNAIAGARRSDVTFLWPGLAPEDRRGDGASHQAGAEHLVPVHGGEPSRSACARLAGDCEGDVVATPPMSAAVVVDALEFQEDDAQRRRARDVDVGQTLSGMGIGERMPDGVSPEIDSASHNPWRQGSLSNRFSVPLCA